MNLKDKKVLLVGLGILGGGLSMAKYLIKEGARLTVTDLRDPKLLEPIIKKLEGADNAGGTGIKYTLGKHKRSDFEKANIIIFNPAVSAESDWVKFAQKLKKPYFNDYTFFLENLKALNPDALTIGVTGTRGKTTISSWINHLIPGSVLAGNIPEKNLLKQMTKKTKVFVLELSSFQLEYATSKNPSPNIAIVTNVYTDHLNRYGTAKKYQDVKFKIFKTQTEHDVLILNLDEKVTKAILAQKPKAHIFFVSLKPLPKSKNGMFFENNAIFYQYEGKKSLATKFSGLAAHEKTNLLTSMLAAHLVGVEGSEIVKKLKDLPNPIFRQQPIFRNKNLIIVNDSAATSPDATTAAIEKFKKSKNFILISGGTNKQLEFQDLAKKIKQNIEPKNLFLLEGSATDLLIGELKKINFSKEIFAYKNLEDIVDVVSQNQAATVVFSPAAASFEKFKNEFDRGKTFNRLVKKYFVS